MTPLIPFAIAIIGAMVSDKKQKSTSYGKAPSRYGLTPLSKPVSIPARKPAVVAPSRFTQGTALASIMAAKGSQYKKILEAQQVPHVATTTSQPSEPQETDLEEPEETEEELVDPQEVVRRQIEMELLIGSIGEEVVDDMELGPQYGSSYYSASAVSPQRLNRIAAGFGANPDIFVPGTGWGIRRKK